MPVPLLLLALTACGGGGEQEVAADCAPATDPVASAEASATPREVPKRDEREVDAVTPEQAQLIAELARAEATVIRGTTDRHALGQAGGGEKAAERAEAAEPCPAQEHAEQESSTDTDDAADADAH